MTLFFILLIYEVEQFTNGQQILAQSPTLENRNSIGLGVICYLYSCEPGYLDSMLYLKATCNGENCPYDVNIKWSMFPQNPNFDFEKEVTILDNGSVIKLRPTSKVFRENETLRFIAYAMGELAEKKIVFKILPLKYALDCQKNCGREADITHDMIVVSRCVAGCHLSDPKQFLWILIPEPDNKSRVITQSNRIIIRANAYNKDVDVRMKFRPSGQWRFGMRVKFRYKEPQLTIKCMKNCEEFHFDQSVTLTAECTAACVKGQFFWSFNPPPEGNAMTENDGNNTSILPLAYKGGVNVTVTVSQGGKGRGLFSFVTKGNCSIEPPFGISGITSFFIHHTYAQDTLMSVYQKIPSESPQGVLLYEGRNLENTSLFLSAGEPANITIIAKDFKHSCVVTAVVGPLPPAAPGETIGQTIKRKCFGKDENTLPSLIAGKNWSEAIQLSALLLTVLSDLKKSFGDHYRNHILQLICSAADEIDPQQLISSLARSSNFASMAINDKLSTSHIMADCMMEAAERIRNRCCNYKKNDLENVASNIMFLAARLANKSDSVNNILQKQYIESDDVRLYDPIAVDVSYEYADALRHLQASTYSVLKSVEAVGHFVDWSNEPVVQAYFKDIIASSTQVFPRIPGVFKAFNVASFLNISQGLARELKEDYKFMCQMASLPPDSFWWHPIAKEIGTEILMVNLFADDFQVTTLKNYLDIYLKRSIDFTPTISGTVANGLIKVHRFSAPAGTKIEFHCRFVNYDYFIYISTVHPTVSDVREKGRLIAKGRDYSKTFMTKKDYFLISVGRWLGYKPRYTMSVLATRCLTWNQEGKNWTSQFCKHGKFSVQGHIHCQCKHFSLFLATIFTPPNEINDLIDFTLRDVIIRSGMVILLLAIVLASWALLMVYVDRRDKMLEEMTGAVLVPADTMPGDSHLYLTCVETGAWIGSGTSSHVAIQFIGEHAVSRVHLIDGPTMLRRGGEDWWAIFSPNDLGIIRFVRLFHDSHGNRPDWFCTRVTIQHPDSRRIFVFVVNQWFSLVRGDGEVDRKVPLTSKKKQLTGKVLFPLHARESLEEEHLLISGFIRPPGSTFTGKERITVAFTMLLLAMLISAMFFGMLDPDSNDPQPLYAVTFEEFLILIQEIIITFPIALILILIFKKARPFPKRRPR